MANLFAGENIGAQITQGIGWKDQRQGTGRSSGRGDGNDGGAKTVWFGMAMSPNPGEHIQKKWQLLNIECPIQGMGG